MSGSKIPGETLFISRVLWFCLVSNLSSSSFIWTCTFLYKNLWWTVAYAYSNKLLLLLLLLLSDNLITFLSQLQVYFDMMRSFRTEFDDLFAEGLITAVEIGMGPSGELKYPSFSERMGWRYPGIGEFQVSAKASNAVCFSILHWTPRFEYSVTCLLPVIIFAFTI